MKLLIKQIPQASYYFLHFWPKYSQNLFPNTLSLCTSNNARYKDQRSVGKEQNKPRTVTDPEVQKSYRKATHAPTHTHTHMHTHSCAGANFVISWCKQYRGTKTTIPHLVQRSGVLADIWQLPRLEVTKDSILPLHTQIYIYIYIYIYRGSQEECARLRESVPYVKVYRYNPKHLYPKLNGYGDNGQRSLKLWQLLHI